MDHIHRARGFTLVEVMVVLAIVAILAALAYPAYTGQVSRSHRADARASLLQAAQFMQRFYSANDRFDKLRDASSTIADQMPETLKNSPANGTALYTLTITATTDEYTLTMAPVTGGRMETDSCGSYRVNSAGQTGNANGTGGLSAAERDACWK